MKRRLFYRLFGIFGLFLIIQTYYLVLSPNSCVIPISNLSYQIDKSPTPNAFEINNSETEPPNSFNLSNIAFSGFIENRGQLSDPEVYYVYQTKMQGIAFKEDRVVLWTIQNDLNGDLIRIPIEIQFLGANPTAPIGQQKTDNLFNYLSLNNSVVHIPAFAEIIYQNIYDGIDLRFYSTATSIKYEFFVTPFADPNLIELQVFSQYNFTLTTTGKDINAKIEEEDFKSQITIFNDNSLTVFQDSSVIPAEFNILSPISYGYAISAYDPTKPILIDPFILEYSVISGSGNAITVDKNGYAYITGKTVSGDAYVTKLSADGTHQIYSTFIEGSNEEGGSGITVDEVGCVYITGSTSSADFPVKNAYQNNYNDNSDAFVLKLSADGSELIYSTYLGKSEIDIAFGIDVDDIGCAYIVGLTGSTNFPVSNAFQNTYGGGNLDAFITKLGTNGSELIYSTFFGGSDWEKGNSIAIDKEGCAYITGTSHSTDLPILKAVQNTNAGGDDAFVMKLSANGSEEIYGTYIGGSGTDEANGIAVDETGCAYIIGTTFSHDFPVVNSYQNSNKGWNDVFVSKLSENGTRLKYSTYIGGTDSEYGYGIAIDKSGFAYITGSTSSTDFPFANAEYTNSGIYSDIHITISDIFVTELTVDGDELVFSTHLNGSRFVSSYRNGIAIDEDGSAYITSCAFLLAKIIETKNEDMSGENTSSENVIENADDNLPTINPSLPFNFILIGLILIVGILVIFSYQLKPKKAETAFESEFEKEVPLNYTIIRFCPDCGHQLETSTRSSLENHQPSFCKNCGKEIANFYL